MSQRYLLSLFALVLVALAQCWGMLVLLLARQVEVLLPGGIAACVFWSWCCWACYLRHLRLGLGLTGGCLLATLALLVLSLLDMLDDSGLGLLGT